LCCSPSRGYACRSSIDEGAIVFIELVVGKSSTAVTPSHFKYRIFGNLKTYRDVRLPTTDGR
jgi:hypothetical protein